MAISSCDHQDYIVVYETTKGNLRCPVCEMVDELESAQNELEIIRTELDNAQNDIEDLENQKDKEMK